LRHPRGALAASRYTRIVGPAVVVVIFTIHQGKLSVLLIERAAPPCTGEWALPGGLLQPRESLEAAAVRKLEGETGVRDVFLEQLYTFDPTGSGDSGVVVSYFALVDSSRARLRPDLEWRPAWRPVRGLDHLAFANEHIVALAEQRLRNKLEYTNVAYSLVPHEFTLTELQSVYEAILGETMDKRNFRRRMVGMGVVQETGRTRQAGAHRPAKLYEFGQRAPVTLG